MTECVQAFPWPAFWDGVIATIGTSGLVAIVIMRWF